MTTIFGEENGYIRRIRVLWPLSDYRHPLGFNIGLATLESAKGLQQHINRLIEQAVNDGTLASLAKKSGLHYAKPIKLWIQSRFNLQQLLAHGS